MKFKETNNALKIIVTRSEIKRAFISKTEYVKFYYNMYKISNGKVITLETVKNIAKEMGVNYEEIL